MSALPFSNLRLRQGAGGDYANGLCVMEAVSWLSGEGATDRPQCACPVLTSFAIELNDALSDKDRQSLLPFAVGLAGTRSPEHMEARLECLIFGVVREIVAPVFRSIGLHDHADKLMNAKTRSELRHAAAAAAAAAAAYAAAAAAAAAAAYAAAAAAARAAARAAAHAAAAAAAAAAAYAAARAVARADKPISLSTAVPILEKAIRLGPNGFDELDAFTVRAESLGRHARDVLGMPGVDA